MSIFEMATRNKYRFPYKGVISVEELWDLNLDQLDFVFKTLNNELKKSEEDSLLVTRSVSKEAANLRTKIEIVKYIFNTKRDEAEFRRNEAARAEKKQKLLDILAKKEDESLNTLSKDELLKMIGELD